jgi:hypothetical protein
MVEVPDLVVIVVDTLPDLRVSDGVLAAEVSVCEVKAFAVVCPREPT